MDIKKYIESGILENYVLGLTSEQENREVQDYAAQYPEIKEELEKIERSLELYAEVRKIKAPVGLEAKILEKIDDSGSALSKDTPAARGKNGTSILLGILFLAAAVAAFWFYKNSRNLKKSNDDLQMQMDSLRIACVQSGEELHRLKNKLEIFRAKDNEKVILKGTQKAPLAIATIHWNKATRKSYLDIINLPAPPPDKQYQLWAIVDGVPMDMGVFEIQTDSTVLQEVPFIENASAFAVTLEQKGGSPTPTLEEMVVIGNI